MVISLNTKLSKSFLLKDFSKTESISSQVVESLFCLAELAERVKEKFGNIVITSGYRTPEENVRVGGTPNSLHLKGRAFDFTSGKTLEEIVEFADELLPAGEFIIYIKNKKISHIHIALPSVVEGKLKAIYSTQDILIKRSNEYIKLQDFIKVVKK